MRTHLSPMDIVVHEGKLWTVNSAHYVADDGEQIVSLCAWRDHSQPKKARASECQIVKDEEDRPRQEVCEGMEFFPETY